MPDEGFLQRWSRRKHASRDGALDDAPVAAAPVAVADARAQPSAPAPAPASVPASAPAADAPRAPTLEDVAQLTPDSDFSAFVARGVDQAVRRTALKKLFSDPHFNVMDGLDVYIDDYNKPSPLPDGMLASLQHAKHLFAGLAREDDAPEQAAPPPPPDATAPPERETP